ncbi:MAG: pyruvate dehydrogenase (acetyl-transferring) E1 component subunit alpha [Actinobacteria bacterium]|nr:pyruvate dehydrogenase (acetyl-transferring) E1 component subunit alpha [Actinomycetota bacterium]MBU1494705.1 pyruvate dehydrogenase (acetyl-transferring) E1 component subunit alpha [Actinomycetota bacterium]
MDLLRILAPDGALLGDAPFGVDETRRLFEAMLTARTYDHKGTAMQKQGRLATYAPFEGQEAAQIGSAAALRPDDWMVATYRDAAAMWMQGYPWESLILGRMGDERGGSPPAGVDVLPPSITVGAHMLHAVGLSWASLIKGDGRIAITYFGDGATSEGDFHEAMNFAGVFRTPTVFLCQNNQYAISMHVSRQTASPTIAQKADGYGMPGVLVDGNDLFAVYAASRRAVERARAGEGPTLIEALTYRTGPHTTADDPRRYRPDDEPQQWLRRDPIDRVRAYLQGQGGWAQEWEDGVLAAASREVEAAVAAAEALDVWEPREIVEGMYAEPTAPLLRQRSALLADLGES